MAVEQHRLILIRHGETEWSKSGRHTGRTELDLTDTGREQAAALAGALAALNLQDPMVMSSPRRRATTTAELAGLTVDDISDVLAEWDYGRYEGLTTAQIAQQEPGWLVWTHGCSGGEGVADVSDRADRAIAMAAPYLQDRDVVFVGHGHFSRAVLTRWIELPISEGIRLAMEAGSIAVGGFEHGVRQVGALGLTGCAHPNPPA